MLDTFNSFPVGIGRNRVHGSCCAAQTILKLVNRRRVYCPNMYIYCEHRHSRQQTRKKREWSKQGKACVINLSPWMVNNLYCIPNAKNCSLLYFCPYVMDIAICKYIQKLSTVGTDFIVCIVIADVKSNAYLEF